MIAINTLIVTQCVCIRFRVSACPQLGYCIALYNSCERRRLPACYSIISRLFQLHFAKFCFVTGEQSPLFPMPACSHVDHESG